jgi:uncharacterized protein YdeI (YjbR/CyaY-like superfamily)
MDAVLQAVLLNAPPKPKGKQLALQFSNETEVQQKELIATKAIDDAAARETASRNIFAQHAIKAHEIEEDLQQSDEQEIPRLLSPFGRCTFTSAWCPDQPR